MDMSPALLASRPPARLEVGGAVLEVFIDSGQYELSDNALLNWAMKSAEAVSVYFGRFPVSHARIRISPSQHGRISNGMSFGVSGAHCKISVGPDTTLTDLRDDWELTHEMVHFSFPSVEQRHHWIEEGIATYVEPIARASVGGLPVEQVWADMVRDMPQGLPKAGDQGLGNTHTWGRTYWGGAIFCLLADVQIREGTGNAKGLRDALRAINRAGGTIEAEWPLERAFEIGDRATYGQTLMDLYRQMAVRPSPVDLLGLWEQLGIHNRGAGIVMDEKAPLAAIRHGIVAPVRE
jgi:hypothetical protein